jgi:hypothetical protein
MKETPETDKKVIKTPLEKEWSFIDSSRAILQRDKQAIHIKPSSGKKEGKESQTDNLGEAEPDINKFVPKC